MYCKVNIGIGPGLRNVVLKEGRICNNITCTRHPIINLLIQSPDLLTIVHTFYRKEITFLAYMRRYNNNLYQILMPNINV